ncbi:MAG: ATP-dependent RNA helicase [Acidobacteria bacterium]|nr:ATP-dependent RNA helicase [Acidobacteriota bacterium]MBV9474661.1 ATP-dependent RNA helicase [Acidobacteriota bacterium]
MQTPLPVDAQLDAIVSLVRAERRAVIVAPPGAGKTTRIPPALAERARTILLQPRRLAARALARRIASERGWTIGEEIGWQIRFERRFSDRTRLLVATEGILTARLQHDPLLGDFDVVVLDEFHERSIHADLALALVKQAADARDDLAVVVMSATMDAEPVAAFLGARIVTIDARSHPIDVRYAPNTSMADAIRNVARDARGHILAFLPGAREIERVRNELALPNVFPLHGSLDVDAQERALAPSREPKIILATNVAETSLTVDGVTDVIDSGLQKVLRFDAETAVDHLIVEQISQDSADQRAGRAGRTAPGRATRLWDERMLLRREREAEVRRVDLASTVLDLLAWGGDPRTFAWYEHPPEHRIEAALTLLQRLGATDGRTLTPLGNRMRRLPLHPRLARVLVEAGDAAVRVCALLSEDVRGLGAGDALALADSPRLDFAARELARLVRHADLPRNADETTVRRALLAAYPDRVAMRREPGSPRLLLSSGTGAVLAREANLHDGEFLVVLDVSGGAEALVRIASIVEREWLTPTHRDVVHTMSNDRVRAIERVWYDQILLREVNVAPDPEEVRRLTNARLRERLDPVLQRRVAFAELDIDWDTLIEQTGAAHLPYDLQRRLDRLAPERLALPSGRTAALEYRDDGSVVASAKLQELFGLADTPRIGPRQTPVTFSLLAPNGRPVQITKDLRSFWNGGYQDVRKELRGRYPRHPWPEDPWTATPTHQTKRKA